MRKLSIKKLGTPAIEDSSPSGSEGVSVEGDGARVLPRSSVVEVLSLEDPGLDCAGTPGVLPWVWRCCTCGVGAGSGAPEPEGAGVVVVVVASPVDAGASVAGALEVALDGLVAGAETCSLAWPLAGTPSASAARVRISRRVSGGRRAISVAEEVVEGQAA